AGFHLQRRAHGEFPGAVHHRLRRTAERSRPCIFVVCGELSARSNDGTTVARNQREAVGVTAGGCVYSAIDNCASASSAKRFSGICTTTVATMTTTMPTTCNA